MTSKSPLVVRARYAWIRGNTLAYDVAILCSNGTIEALAPLDSDIATRWMERAANTVDAQWLLPGFINAHCHLEYSDFEGSLPSGPVPFGQWLDAILEKRLKGSRRSPKESVLAGAAQLLAGGCTTVVDSTTHLESQQWLSETPLRHFIFHEVLGLSPQRAHETMNRALEAIGQNSSPDGRFLGHGINPHAPYSCGPELRALLRSFLSDRNDIPCAWHLGETPDEDEILSSGSGSITEFLKRRGMALPLETPDNGLERHPLGAAAGFLEQEQLLEPCDVVFHGNTIAVSAYKKFRAPKAVVYCPGTHRYFARPTFHVEQWLAAGANVCLGTDSKASAASLSMLDMLRLAAEDFPSLTGPQLIRMATANPARSSLFKNCPFPIGTIQPGAAADFVALSNADAQPQSLRDLLVSVNTQVEKVIIAAQLVYDFASQSQFKPL